MIKEIICKCCQLSKKIDDFYIRKNGKHQSNCKNCTKEKMKKKYEQDKESINLRRKEIRETNKDQISESRKEYYQKNKERIKKQIMEYYYENKDDINEKRRNTNNKTSLEYYHRNKEQLNTKAYSRIKKRRENDSLYRLTNNIRSLIRISFKNNFTEKSKKTVEILGCTFEEFKLHLESQFDENMNWKNQGTYWHMDHIIPISSAQNEEEVYKLNHYTNFQPLYWEDNLRKSNKMSYSSNFIIK